MHHISTHINISTHVSIDKYKELFLQHKISTAPKQTQKWGSNANPKFLVGVLKKSLSYMQIHMSKDLYQELFPKT